MGSPASYPIGVAARLTGLSVETLRAWERRYRIVEPKREGGVRAYGVEDVAKLRSLRELVDAGHSIGRLAALDEGEIRALLDAQRGVRDRDGAREVQHAGVDAVWRALERFDVDGADAALARLAAVLPAEVLCLEVALPLLRKVGDAWSEGRVGVAHEHLISGALRT